MTTNDTTDPSQGQGQQGSSTEATEARSTSVTPVAAAAAEPASAMSPSNSSAFQVVKPKIKANSEGKKKLVETSTKACKHAAKIIENEAIRCGSVCNPFRVF